jgi:catechol 2,3-dioxygenase-like lactoylglutathione lyase family enzyme
VSLEFAVRKVDHVHITAPEELEEDVIRWYVECLGLERVQKPDGTQPRGAWFRIGEQEIHISRDQRNPPHLSHFGVEVDDIEAVVRTLREAGCHIEQASTIPGRRRFYTRDPAGNRIEFLTYDGDPGA